MSLNLRVRVLFLALLLASPAPQLFGQSASTSQMGAAGASGGVAGGSAVAGAQGAGSRGAADGGGPNLSPVIPSGSRAVNNANGSSQFGSAFSRNGSIGAAGTLNQRPSARQRFGSGATPRGTAQNTASTGLFAPGSQAFGEGAGGAVRPNRTYRSDLGDWQIVGPFQAGSVTNPFPPNGLVGNAISPAGVYLDGGAAQQYLPGMESTVATAATSPAAVGVSNINSSNSNSLTPPGMADNALADQFAAPAEGVIAVRPTMGVTMASGFTGSGARVNFVARNSPAARAGLRPGDVITSVNGMGVYHFQDVVAAMETVPPAGSFEVIAWRNGQSLPLTLSFAGRSQPAASDAIGFDPARTSASGAVERKLAHVETLVQEAQTELRQLRDAAPR